MSSAFPRRPNTFLIGAPKCGTTTVAQTLAQHSEVFLPFPKEPGYFASDLQSKNVTRVTDEREYLNLFSRAPDNAKCRLDASVNYLYSSVAVKEILRSIPNAKFIVILRNPVDQVIAQHQEQVFNQNENIRDFWSAWQMQGKRAKGLLVPMKCSDPKKLLYRERSSLGDQLERCSALIPAERLFVRFLEDLSTDPETFYRELQSFLSLNYESLDLSVRAKTARDQRFPMVARLLQNSPPWSKPAVRWLKKHLSNNRLTSKDGLVRLLLVKTASKPHLTTDQRQILQQAFESQILKLEKITQRDLDHWKS